jgi:hypothetical protein
MRNASASLLNRLGNLPVWTKSNETPFRNFKIITCWGDILIYRFLSPCLSPERDGESRARFPDKSDDDEEEDGINHVFAPRSLTSIL